MNYTVLLITNSSESDIDYIGYRKKLCGGRCDFQVETLARCLTPHGDGEIQTPTVSSTTRWALVITAVVSFDEDSFRCAEELEHSCKQHSSEQTGGDIHTAQLSQSMK